MTTRSAAVPATPLCLAMLSVATLSLATLCPAAPASAATCHMTVQGVPVIDDTECTSTGTSTSARRGGDVRVAVGAEDVIRIRRSAMSGRFLARRARDGGLRRVTVSYGQVVTSTDSDSKTCYFNQKATLCVDP